MVRFAIIFFVILFVVVAALVVVNVSNNSRGIDLIPRNQLTKMRVSSPVFKKGESIPSKYTCEGENTNPQIDISGVPPSAKSLALIMDDPDAPKRTFTHWLVWNVSPEASELAENGVPSGAVQGNNSANKLGYTGPCPPSGTHRYFFKIYALDAMLDLKSGIGRNELETEIQKHLIEKNEEFFGVYEKKNQN